MIFLFVRDNEAKMLDKTGCDVLEEINHTTSDDSGDVIGVQDHVTDMGYWSGSESEEVKKTVGISISLEKGKSTTAFILC